MKKYKKIILIVLLIILIVVGIGVYYWLKNPTRKEGVSEAQKTTTDFVTAWGNTENKGSDEYVESIKPYLSQDLFKLMQSESDDLKSTGEQFPSKTEVKEIVPISSKDNTFIFQVKINHLDISSNIGQDETLQVEAEKKNGAWVITNLDEDITNSTQNVEEF